MRAKLSSCILAATTLLGSCADTSQQTPTLLPGVKVEGLIACGDDQQLSVDAAAGEFLDLVVDQQGVDLKVELIGPTGQVLASRDHPNGAYGLETVAFVTPEAGRYTLVISCPGDSSGTYVAELRHREEAHILQRRIARADQLIAEASLLRDQEQGGVAVRQAKEWFEEALALSQESHDRYRQASAMRGLGLCYFRLGRAAEALPLFSESIPLLDEIGEERDMARSMTSVGWALDALGRSDEAIEVLERALGVKLSQDDRVGVGVVLNNLANAYMAVGEPQTALELFQRSAEVRREVGSKRGEAVVLTNMGKLFNSLGDSERAIATLSQASVLWNELDETYGKAVTQNNLGQAFFIAEQFEDAASAYQTALNWMTETGNDREISIIRTNLGLVRTRTGDTNGALELFQQAEKIFLETGDGPGLAGLTTNRGLALVAAESIGPAIQEFDTALQLWHRYQRPLGEATALYGLAQARHLSGDLNGALDAMKKSIQTLESLRAKLVSPGLRQTFFVSKDEFFDFYIELLMELSESSGSTSTTAEALGVCELARARSLRDYLLLNSLAPEHGASSELVEQENALRRQIRARDRRHSKLLGKQAPSEEITAVESDIESLLGQYDELLTAMRRDNPRLAELYGPRKLDLPEIQGLLPHGTLVLEFDLAREVSFVWAITRSSLHAYRLPSEQKIEKAVVKLHRLVRERRGRSSSKAALDQAAEQLSRMVLEPVAAHLQASDRLIVVPDGALHLVPFAALPLTSGESQAPNHLLIETHELVNLPSLSVLAEDKVTTVRKVAARTVAVFADPVFSTGDERLRGEFINLRREEGPTQLMRAARDVGIEEFPRLPATRLEAEVIENLVAPDSRLVELDFAASRQRLLTESLDDYRIVHLATHGVLNARHPELTGLVFSLVDENGAPRDGFLQALDLFNLRLNAELVVLSACETALGTRLRGEGILGLTRGFFFAGSRNVMATLWGVDDPATARLMEAFYRGLLKQGLGPSAALRRAQLSLLREQRYSSIFYWGPFVLQAEAVPPGWIGPP